VRHAVPLLVLLALAWGAAQPATGAWTVESDFDLFSYNGLGAIWLPAYQHPDDLPAEDALLVVGCDPNSPNGYELSAWVASLPFAVTTDFDGEVSVLVRFDQGPVLTQTWFLADSIGVQEAVAFYDANDALFAGLTQARNLALRVQADAITGVPERTLQYDVTGFSAALAQLRCGEAPEGAPDDAAPEGAAPGDTPDAPPAGMEPTVVGAWTIDDEDGFLGMLAIAADGAGVIGLYCSDVDNRLEIDVGRYGLTQGDVYDVTFRSGNIDFLTATATVGPFGAPQLDGDDVEERLVRFLRGVVDLTVTLTPRRTGATAAPFAFTSSTLGFNDAFAAIGCR
jgi:hypothetical protein